MIRTREEKLLQLVARGYKNKEIAAAMNITVQTARTYLKRIYEKLHVRSRLEAVMKVIKT